VSRRTTHQFNTGTVPTPETSCMLGLIVPQTMYGLGVRVRCRKLSACFSFTFSH